MKKVLGLDMGSNSIGWALIDEDEKIIIDMGVRVFQEGVNNLNNAKEESKNADRRRARLIRRQLYRRKQRMRKLLRNLIEYNIITNNDIEYIKELNPYEIRKRGLYEKLELKEFARALLHICRRRGYKSNRKENIDDKEKGAIFDGKPDINKPGINELRKVIDSGEFKTIGEYFCSLNPHEIRIRNRFTERSMYIDEFNKIWDKQAEFHKILTDSLKIKFRDEIIFYQRSLKSQKHTIGKCVLIPNKRRAPRSSLLYQEFRMLQQVNSLKITGGNRIDEAQQMLTQEERTKLIELLKTVNSVKFDKIRKLFNLPKKDNHKFNLENQDKIDGLSTYSQISNVFGERLKNLNDTDIENIWKIIYFAKDDEWLKNYAMKNWGLNEEDAIKITKIRLEKDYGNLSKKALNKIVPLMRNGLKYHEAAIQSGFDFSLVNEVIEKTDYLPDPPNVANPIVNVAMHQLKKVINSIIDYYGKPDTIRVEMARDLKFPRKKRLEMLKNNREQEKWHKEIIDKLIKDNIVAEPTRNDIIKYKLWQECNGICPYTGRSISIHQLYNGEVDIEHILPYSRTLNDSYMNKSLCFKDENIRKGNRTPYEAYHGNPILYNEIKTRVKDFPFVKAKYFYMDDKEFEEKVGDFAQKQLNDTRYISRLSLNYLKHLTDDVQVSTGQITATLRHLWGLNSVIPLEEKAKDENKKSREDHRHHAIDALVTALTTRSFVMQLSTYSRVFEDRTNAKFKNSDVEKDLQDKFPYPWESFRKDVIEKINNIIVSHRAMLKVRGAMHEETLYGKLKDQYGNDLVNASKNQMYAVRKPLTDAITDSQIHNIIDPVVKKTVLDRIKSFGIDTNKKFKVPAQAFTEPLYLVGKKGTKTPIKSVRISVPSSGMINIRNYNVWAEPGANHHIIIYIDENGKQKGKPVTLFQAYQRKRLGLPIIDKTLEPNQEFIMSLQRNEMIIWGELPDDFDYADKSTYHLVFDSVYRLQKMSDVNLIFRLHNSPKTDDTKHKSRLQKTASGLTCQKIIVTPAGFIEFKYD